MKYEAELKNAEELEDQGQHLQAAKAFEEIGRKFMREGGEERVEAPKIIAKSIAHYLLAEEKERAQELAFQVLFMKEEHPLLSIQVEAALASKKEIIRLFEVSSLPNEINSQTEILQGIPENQRLLKDNSEVIVKKFWEGSFFGFFEEKYDLLEQKYSNIKDLINFILGTKTGLNVIGIETASGKRILLLMAITFNENPIEVIQL